MSDIAFSRSGESDPRGKRDTPLETSVTAVTAEEFGFLAMAAGFNSKAEFLRYLVERELYGTLVNARRVVRMPGTVNPENSR